jgi:hypothetical protein
MKQHLRLATALAATLFVTTAAQADSPFILPSSTSLSGGNNVVTFDAAGSDHVFSFDHRPIQLASIKVTQPDGTAGTPTNTVQGRFRSVLDVKLEQDGTYKIASGQSMITGTFMLNGEQRRVGGRPGGPGGTRSGWTSLRAVKVVPAAPVVKAASVACPRLPSRTFPPKPPICI